MSEIGIQVSLRQVFEGRANRQAGRRAACVSEEDDSAALAGDERGRCGVFALAHGEMQG